MIKSELKRRNFVGYKIFVGIPLFFPSCNTDLFFFIITKFTSKNGVRLKRFTIIITFKG